MSEQLKAEIESRNKLAALLQQKLRTLSEYEYLLDQKRQEIREKEAAIKELKEKQREISDLSNQQAAKIKSLEELNEKIMTSKGWQLLNAFRGFKGRFSGA